MNLTKSVRGLAFDINAAPNYDSNDDVSENEKIHVKCVHNMPSPVVILTPYSPHVDGVLSSIALRLHLQSSG